MSGKSESDTPADNSAHDDGGQRLVPGFSYPSYDIVIGETDQADKLRCCNVDPTVFGDRVDITAYAMEGILAARRAGVSINGSVHMTQTFSLHSPIRLGERLYLRGKVVAEHPDPRGRIVDSEFEVVRSDGSIPLTLGRSSLRMDAERAAAARAPTADGARKPSTAAWDGHGFVLESNRQLEPDKVARYSIEAENLIHSDPEVARRFGFRAPIAGGLMAVRMMMEVLARRGPIDRLEMAVRFRRPMFWDEQLRVYANWDDGRMVVLNGEDKIANEARVSLIEHG
ncbi:MAG: hypothetical protein KDK91_07340 [Gammaproteobacteria bacterium]|nr:hypothetical protein [Gammaproteobacteria bacterium]